MWHLLLFTLIKKLEKCIRNGWYIKMHDARYFLLKEGMKKIEKVIKYNKNRAFKFKIVLEEGSDLPKILLEFGFRMNGCVSCLFLC